MIKTNREKHTSYRSHFKELRERIIFSFLTFVIFSAVIYFKADIFINFLTSVFDSIFREGENIFYTRNIFEGFIMRIRLSLIIGVIFSFPIFLYHIIRFIFPAISKKASRTILISICFALILAVSSSYFSLKYLIPFVINTMTTSNFIPKRVGILLDYSSIMLPLSLTFWIILAFQVPVVITDLMYLELIKRKTVLRFIKPLIVLIFVVSAIITPPDMITQIAISLPLILLLLLSILISKVFRFGE